MREPRNLNEFPLQAGEFPVEGYRDVSFLGEKIIDMNQVNNGGYGVNSWTFVDELTSLTPLWQFIKRKEQNMTTNKTGLVDQVQAAIENFRDNTPIGVKIDFRELAVSIVRVFRDYIEAEIKMPDAYDKQEPGKGQGWE